MIEHGWEVEMALKGREIGVLPTFITNATLYVTASSAKEACYLAERYVKGLQEMDIFSVKLWGVETNKYEQEDSGGKPADPINEALRGEQRFESGDTYSGSDG